ncbi:NADH:ubiquinone oxidoreductase, subunit G, iron- sulfur binding protein [Denitrovibrio acetiphilus DSM 12809]|uniref:NADH:ubiquinone oxidoreductase, subunit G, iron-sulfur binding protein n=1 Tax=Denitrovibrio acetiphilus (strain DSM 12809 / NBRC 114555 / N2460) TaxID=522772 RepID=D4H4C4_DENA2|nr:molybdopterin-dependent oxidoreductase [Denitrovibrio acetiphilus]ADD69253.1 NADH:ubiquinone oxidoreductase, subunit G, iron- sulfur binding protein [Denitrovibrio acetiphilus DSM 12809]
MSEIIINNKPYSFDEGESILDVAERNGIHIPTLCYLKDVTPTGACRLCLVQVEGAERLQAACVTYAKDGMKIETDNEHVWKNRKDMLDFILIKHPLDCPICDKAGECELQDTAFGFGMMEEQVSSDKPAEPIEYWNKIVYNSNLCVLCEKCIKSCHEMTGCSALKMEDRGFYNHVTPSKGDTLKCDFCGTCIDRCPVGALLDSQFHHSARVWDLENKVTSSVFSPTGGAVEYGLKDGKIYRAKAVGSGQITAQDRFAFKYLDSAERALNPMASNNGSLSQISWEETEALLKDKLAGVKPEEIAFVAGSTITNEAFAAYKKFMDAVGSKKLTSEADISLGEFYDKYSAKFGTMENIGTLDDIKDSDVVFVIGCDLRREAVGVKHKIMNAVIHNDAKLYVAGVQKYEYDLFTTKTFMAEYGDFAGALEEMKKDAPAPSNQQNPNIIDVVNDPELYVPAVLKKAKKVSIVIGEEYIQSGTDADAVLAFCDFLGKDLLKSVFVINDQVNYMGAVVNGYVRNGYTAQKLTEELRSGAVKVVVNAGFNARPNCKVMSELESAFSKAGTYIAADIFKTGSAGTADIILPVKDSLETVGTFTTLDGRLVALEKIVEAKGSQKTHVQVASMLASLMGQNVTACAYDTFHGDIAGKNGFPDVDYSEVDGTIVKEKSNEWNSTPYSYSKPAAKTFVYYMFPRYYTNIITAKSYLAPTEESREYFFPVVKQILAGEDAEYAGAEQSPTVAKGVVAVTRDF